MSAQPNDIVVLTRSLGVVIRETLAKALEPLNERLTALEARPPAEPGPAGRDGIDGKDGAPGERGPEGAQGMAGLPGITGAAGKDGSDGKDGEDGKEGPAGRDGADGRDALQLDILPALDERKHYPRGTYAMHRGGLWRSFKTTDAMNGWECVVVGHVGERFEQRGARDFVYVVETSLGVNEFAFSMPVPLDAGVYRAGETYQHGDGVTYGGSWWLAQRDTSDKPGESDAWRLTVKRGRDGKDGARGPEGKVVRVREKADG